jgi:hypothetical protein
MTTPGVLREPEAAAGTASAQADLPTGLRRLGLVADTHGQLAPDVVERLGRERVELILHAGDIGGLGVLAELERVAPVVAVSGNGDEELYHRFPWDLRLRIGSRRVFLCHWYDNYGRIHPTYARVVEEWRPHVLVHGHTHQAGVEARGATLFVNPGYAGPAEPSRRRTLAVLDLASLEARILPLDN